MTSQDHDRIAEAFIHAWNTQDVATVLACYTPDVLYRDPNTRGFVTGRQALGRYLTKLFSRWNMHWDLREVHTFAGVDGQEGSAVLWTAELAPVGRSHEIVTVDGMDLALLRDGLLSRNEVYFDRTVLAPLVLATTDSA
jgi:ketosteroid isomerase-like protein